MTTALFMAFLLAFTTPLQVHSPLTGETDQQAGLTCYWTCMGLCIIAGKRQDDCDAACTDLCFTITTPPAGPTCEPDEGPVACAE